MAIISRNFLTIRGHVYIVMSDATCLHTFYYRVFNFIIALVPSYSVNTYIMLIKKAYNLTYSIISVS